MIKINKGNNIPPILANQGATSCQKLKNEFAANPNAYKTRRGVRVRDIVKLVTDSDIYGDTAVKDILKIEQHHKCCFCEGKFQAYGYGDVEHFRPKGGYVKRGKRSITYPGYYWLAYDWGNLMFSCQICNGSYKKNHFPLYNESFRVQNHLSVRLLANENPMLINPISEHPNLFIVFNLEIPIPRPGLTMYQKQKAQKSIEVFGLDRPLLNEDRLEYISDLDCILEFAKIDLNDPVDRNTAMTYFKISEAQLRTKVKRAIYLRDNAAKDSSKFTLLVRSNFPELPVI